MQSPFALYNISYIFSRKRAPSPWNICELIGTFLILYITLLSIKKKKKLFLYFLYLYFAHNISHHNILLSMLNHRSQFVPSSPKDILFPELTSEDALNSLLWETCAPARIANRARVLLRRDSSSSSSYPAFVPVFVSPPGLPAHRCTTEKTPLHARRRRESQEKGGQRRRDTSCRVPRKRETTLVVRSPGRGLVSRPAIHISRHENLQIDIGAARLRKNDSSRFDSWPRSPTGRVFYLSWLFTVSFYR